ncbi:unnamed protein product [Lampetra planeri]
MYSKARRACALSLNKSTSRRHRPESQGTPKRISAFNKFKNGEKALLAVSSRSLARPWANGADRRGAALVLEPHAAPRGVN